MKRIIFHWTAGTYKVSALDRQHYHFIVAGNGTVVAGVFKPEDNLAPVKGKYAAHTLNCNTGSIGVAVACMAGAEPGKHGAYPMTQVQWTALIGLVAKLANEYNIPVTPSTILSHAEVQDTLQIKQRGKWDIAELSFAPHIKGAREVGNLMRSEVKLLLTNIGPLGKEKAAPLSVGQRIKNWLKGNRA